MEPNEHFIYTDSPTEDKVLNALFDESGENRDNSIREIEAEANLQQIEIRLAHDASWSSAIGGIVGAFAGILISIGIAFIMPGLFAVGGIFAVALAGAGAGCITGGILGALIGWSVSEEDLTN